MKTLLDKINQLKKPQRLQLLEMLQSNKVDTVSIIENSNDVYSTEPLPQQTLQEKENIEERISDKLTFPFQDYYLSVQQWGKGEALDIPDKNIYQIFEEFAQNYLGKSAITMGDDSITYQQLIQKIEQLCYALQKQYIFENEAKIVVFLPRSIDAVVTVMAILKLGYAFIPIDIMQPMERINKIIMNLQPNLIITYSTLQERLSQKINLFMLDKLTSECNPIIRVTKKITPHNLAYILYTSGTTGVPKGVMIEHRSVVNFVFAMLRSFEITYLDRIIFFASISFDVAIFEIFTALFSGGELIIANDEERVNPQLLSRLLNKFKITVAELPPALLPHLNPNDFPALRLLSVGGEKFVSSLIFPWVGPHRRVINGYGPTETTVAVTLYEYRRQPEKTPAIGRPIANHQVYVINANQNLVTVGTMGELCIAGVGVSRGYYNQPELTQDRFINLWVDGRPIRVYKTGDLVRWRRDGHLEILGRVDRQVKIRGYRIELGEIETAILAHEKVQQAVVNAVKLTAEAENFILLAYIVPKVRTLELREIHEWLAKKLPVYMLPTSIVFLDSIPLTANGKIDFAFLNNLPRLTAAQSEVITTITPTQLIIQKIFARILENKTVGLQDNFFYLGGNSLLAAQVTNEIKQVLDYPIRMVDFLEFPTIQGLSTLIDANHNKQSNQEKLKQIYNTIYSPWLISQANHNAEKYCVYFHCAGGSCMRVKRWQKKLNSSIQLIGIQLPAHDQRLREIPIDDIELLSDLIAAELTDLFVKPVYFVGHSMGALLSFAVCQKLKVNALFPELFIAVASRAPQKPPQHLLHTELLDELFLQKLQLFGGLNSHFLNNAELISSYLPAIRADTKISETYYCDRAIASPIFLMLGENDQFCNDESIFDWKKLTTAQFNHATFAGGHFFIHEHEDIFIEQLNNLLSLTTISEKGEIYERSICYR